MDFCFLPFLCFTNKLLHSKLRNMKTLLKNARILSMEDDQIKCGHIVIEDNRIIYIGSQENKFAPYDVVRDIKGNLLMPGFKNAHTHSAMTFLRSKTDDYNLQDWLFKVVFPREELLRESDVYYLSKVAFLEYLTSGITACFDQYYFPLSTGKAAQELGMRTVLLGTYNELYGKEDIRKLYHQLNDTDGLVKYCFGIHAEYTCPDDELEIMRQLVQEEKAMFYTHISETAKEVQDCIEKRGKSPVKLFIDKGLYDYGGGGYHCIHFSKEDAELWKKYNLSIVTCPGSNTKLASGIAPVKYYVDLGLNIAIGTDGPASNNSLDMFKEMTLVYASTKIREKDPTALDAFTILKMATINGAKAMGLKDNGLLKEGYVADIIEIDLTRPNMQPINNIINNIVFSGSKDNVAMTMINGKILYADRNFYVGQDVNTIYKECQEVTDRIEKEYHQRNGGNK